MDTQAATKITTIDKLTTGTTIETEGTNRTHNTTKEIIVFRTGMTIIKTETGSTTEDNQPNTNTTETNLGHR